MSECVLIQNATLAGETKPQDILICSGVIQSITPVGSGQVPAEAKVIDAAGKLILPGLFDIHAHLCQPGFEAKETIATATAAALHGGVTGLMAMPDTAPVMDNAAQITTFMDICRREALVDVIPSGCLIKGDAGEEQASYDSLRAKGVQYITTGTTTPQNLLLLYRAMQYTSNLQLTFALCPDVPELTAKATMHPSTTSYTLGLTGAPPCAEEIGLETIIRLSAATGNALHVQTVSTAGSVEILRRCKRQTPGLTAEVALHHLLFTHADVGRYDTNFKTFPPLREQSDVDALIAAVNDGTIDCIVSDHTPCTPFSKLQDFVVAPAGMIALDTFLPAIYHYLVAPGKMTWQTVLRACNVAPRQCMGLEPVRIAVGEVANLSIFDPEGTTTVTVKTLESRAQNTPFIGKTLRGKVDMVIFSGRCHCFVDKD